MTTLPDYLQGFTDREAQIAAFDALWDDRGRWALVFSEHSGVGKSHLIDYLIETRCKPQQISYRKVDYDGVVALDDVPQDFSRLLPVATKGEFDHAARRLRDEHDLAIAELNKNVPHSVTLSQIADRSGRIADSPATIDVQYQERRRDLSLLFFTQLARLALDHAAALGSSRAVLILDTYEKFADNNKDEIIGRVWWFVSQAVEQAPGGRFLRSVVVTSAHRHFAAKR